ncbi:Inosine-5'-monophosphate dehydrogenase / CBS domain [Euzebya pacifica]|jgi:CBS domain-containing protein|uniref:Inosine-5'-monophosphate dehydrogenase / CBS domain n=1 Tax=Euzebya pacifica TaxID=1608957 RepID=A0A346XS97_9ACTN|nr:CBS domain-containing protein [Euzebya pacifica]AXV05094.1 Inosine-5'-monophosphate dehydrogenase / CBS domain [Euzebya pacifica]
MQVQYFMTPDPKVVSPDETVDAAWDRMASIQAHHLPVVEDGVLIGIISDRDLRDDLDGLVRDVMTREPITVRPEDGLIEAGKVLLSNQINAVPVVDGNGILVGVLTTTNCLIAMIQLNHELELARS